MILIFSNARDQATNGVVAWLDRYGRSFVRVNDDVPERHRTDVQLGNGEFRFKDGDRWRCADEISAIWYRKGSFWFPTAAATPELAGQPALNALIARKLQAESRVCGEFFQHLMQRRGVRTLGNPRLGDPNKLIVLHEAEKLGLKTPRFQVVNRIGSHHLANPSAFITKAMSDGIYLWDNEEASRGYFSYTEDLAEVVATVSDDLEFPLSMIQEKIPKRFEVRAFFLDGRFACAAIYSQDDPQTATDYRKYNTERPNRNVPITLPTEVEDRLRALFGRLELNTGSVDLIVDDQGDFVVLEINPFGIYGSLQAICNFNIDRAIARWLCGEADDDWC